MLLQSSNHKLDYYNRMQDLEDRLRRSEDERMSLRRQFDLLLQSNHEKERARVSAVEARYKRFLDEDRRRRDRNSSLLQALDRIDSHTASLAAKTERMRALRKHYETFLAHAYPGWNTGIDRSYCPLAAIAPAPNVMTRVTEVTGYDSGSPQYFHDPTDYSETQYHTLPSKPFSTLATPLCRSELSLSSREDYPGVGRSLYRSGSAAVRSASLSPTRVRELASADGDKITPLRHYDFYSQAKSPDVSLKKESYTSKRADTILSPNPPRFHNDILEGVGLEKQSLYNRPSTTNHRFMDYSQGNSDVEADQNTSGDLLNISNLSLADDYILNDDSDIPKSPPYSGASQRSYSPRDHGISRKSPSVSLFTHDSARQIISPREIFVPKRSVLSSAVLTHSPKSILSPRNRKIDLSSSPSSSESVHRNLLPTENLDSILSPRRQKLSWQTLRPSYFPPAPRSPIRRSVTFTEPEYDNLYMYRDDGGGLYSGSYGSLRRHSPSTLSSPWESSDHERFLRDKHGREKDAFREKIERLKELIQENKVEDVSLHDDAFEKGKTSPLVNHQPQEKTSRENSVERDWKMVQSRRSSLVGQLSFDNEDQVPSENNEINSDKKLVRDFVNEDLFSDTVSDKEQWSGQFSEKDEDISEKDAPHVGSEFLSQDLDFNESSSFKSNEILEHEKNKDSSNGQEDVHKMEEKSENHLVKESLESYSNLDQLSYKPTDFEPEEEAREQVDYNYDNQVQSLGDDNSQNVLADESISKDTTSFALKEESQQGQENPPSVNKSDSQSILHGDQKTYADHDNMLSYEDQPQQQQQKQLRQDWSANEADASQNMKFSYDQEDQLSSTNYDDEPNQSVSLSRQEGGFEQYVTDDEKDQQSYKTYQSNDNQQPQVHGDYVDSSEYKSYGETQQTANSGGAYQTYSEDPNQYQEPYETFSEDQQYEELQDQNYTPQDQNNYQYSQDPNKTQYKYEGQDYNYQQGQDDYNYSRETTAYQQEPTYQQDALYQQDQTYQQDPSYQPDQSYIQDQNYQQDDQYKQPIDYQQDQAYQDIGYEGTQQYGGYQQRTDDYSEDTSPSVDSNYQGQFQGNESANPKDLKDYHALLGADSNSEPAYSDSSELEKQMAAVVGETGSSIKGLVEPQVTPPPPSTPPVVSVRRKEEQEPKKKPQLTRKQSSITPDSADVKQQQSSTLPKVSETGQGASQHQNESDTSSSR